MPPLKKCYVCSVHFPSDSFELRSQIIGENSHRRLKKDVVPSLFSFSKPKHVENRLRRKRNIEVSHQYYAVLSLIEVFNKHKLFSQYILYIAIALDH